MPSLHPSWPRRRGSWGSWDDALSDSELRLTSPLRGGRNREAISGGGSHPTCSRAARVDLPARGRWNIRARTKIALLPPVFCHAFRAGIAFRPCASGSKGCAPHRRFFRTLILALIAGDCPLPFRVAHTSNLCDAPSFLMWPAVGAGKCVPMMRMGLSAQSLIIARRVARPASLSLSKAGAHSGCAIWQG